MERAGGREEAHRRTAIVTGANRGLGFEICRQLAGRGLRVVLTSRNAAAGREAASRLNAERVGAGPGGRPGSVEAFPLDVADPASVEALAAAIPERWGAVDALVNNAGIALDGFDAQVARRTLDVNVYGAQRVTARLRPLLAPQARIVMVSSGLGELSILSPPLRRAFEDPLLSWNGLAELLERFVRAVKAGTYAREGWPGSAYGVSKAGLNALTRVLARALDGSSVAVNAVCPGWVRTDMGGRHAPLGPAEGADTAVWAATLPPGGPSGKFFRERREIPW
jgi:carbonyl reductase 1